MTRPVLNLKFYKVFFLPKCHNIQTKISGIVCFIDIQNHCFTETWLNYLCFDQKLFSDFFTIFVADRESSIKSRGCGVLIAACSRVRARKRKHDL
jgi:hypothetical protein